MPLRILCKGRIKRDTDTSQGFLLESKVHVMAWCVPSNTATECCVQRTFVYESSPEGPTSYSIATVQARLSSKDNPRRLPQKHGGNLLKLISAHRIFHSSTLQGLNTGGLVGSRRIETSLFLPLVRGRSVPFISASWFNHCEPFVKTTQKTDGEACRAAFPKFRNGIPKNLCLLLLCTLADNQIMLCRASGLAGGTACTSSIDKLCQY